MTNRNPLSIFRHRIIKWLTLILFFGALIVFLWPRSDIFENDIFIPIEIEEIPRGLTLSKPIIKGIDVRIQGPKSVIENLPDRKLRYILDLSGSEIGAKSIPIRKEHIPFPEGISVIKTTPTVLNLMFEKEFKKNVPVVISLVGKPASGYFVADTVAKPATILLKGSKNILDPMEKILTKPIDVNGLSEYFKKEIALDLAEGLQTETLSGIVLTEVFIEEKIVVRRFENIPVAGKDTLYAHTITPSSINIEVKGPENVLEKLSTGDSLKVYVDLNALKPGVYVRCATITLPVKTSLVGVTPEVFTVKIADQLTRMEKKNPKPVD